MVGFRRGFRKVRAFALFAVLLLVALVKIRSHREGDKVDSEEFVKDTLFLEEDSSVFDEDSLAAANPKPLDYSKIPTPQDALTCDAWLDREFEKSLSFIERDFSKNPVSVVGLETRSWDSCDVPCKHSMTSEIMDAAMGPRRSNKIFTVVRNMESSENYPQLAVDAAHSNGYDIVMTTSLKSDVPVGYFSWAEYDIMKPVTQKQPGNVAAAFISNCGAINFRLKALEKLPTLGVPVDSYGKCNNNRESRGASKVDIISQYKFYLAFENSNEEDYVTEKYLQALVAGTVPIYIGAPNIEDFEPQPNSVIRVDSLDDVPNVASRIKYLMANETAYNEMLRWKKTGPTSKFLALVDMAVVHSSCRLCIHIATGIRGKELENSEASFQCRDPKSKKLTFYIQFRERGRFEYMDLKMEIPMDFANAKPLQKLKGAIKSLLRETKHEPIWMSERPDHKKSFKNGQYNIYRIYPIGSNQREALYGNAFFKNDLDLMQYLVKSPIPLLEIILV